MAASYRGVMLGHNRDVCLPVKGEGSPALAGAQLELPARLDYLLLGSELAPQAWTMALRHLVEQRRSLAALGKIAFSPRGYLGAPSVAPERVPGPAYSELSPAPPGWLLDEYLDLVGADRASYRESLPPHLFPQWTFPTLVLALETSGLPLARIINAGCRLQIAAPISRYEPLVTQTQLVRAEEKENGTLLTTRVATGNPDRPRALVAEVTTLVPARRGASTGGKPRSGQSSKERRRGRLVPETAELVTRFDLSPSSAQGFANLTGDFNPIHWLRPYARMMGFSSTILHGFASFAWCFEGLVRGRLNGQVSALREIEARFTKPLPLPASPGLFVTPDQRLVLGDAPGGPMYLDGSYLTGQRTDSGAIHG